MPNLDGIEATRRIVSGMDGLPRVLVLTTFDLDEYVYEALRAGASGFLLKDAPEEQLVAGIRIVADGGSLFAPAVTRRLIERFAGTAPQAPPPSLAELTPRELEVLGLFARGLSNAEIAGELVLSEHTAKTHVAHILGKLDLRSCGGGGARLRIRDRPCARPRPLIRAISAEPHLGGTRPEGSSAGVHRCARANAGGDAGSCWDRSISCWTVRHHRLRGRATLHVPQREVVVPGCCNHSRRPASRSYSFD